VHLQFFLTDNVTNKVILLKFENNFLERVIYIVTTMLIVRTEKSSTYLLSRYCILLVLARYLISQSNGASMTWSRF